MTRISSQVAERDRELYNPQIAWLLCACAAELGERSGLAGTVSVIERGGPSPGVPNTDPYGDYTVGWCAGDGPVDKWRKAWPIWTRLGAETQAVLVAHYTLRNDLPEQMRVAVDGALGKLGSAALWVHEGEALSRLMTACHDRGKEGRGEVIAAAAKRAEVAVRQAHRIWGAIADFRPEGRDEQSIAPASDPGAAKRWEAEYGRTRESNRRVREVLYGRLAASFESFGEHIRLAVLGSFECSARALAKARASAQDEPRKLGNEKDNPLALARPCKAPAPAPEATATK